MGVKCKIEGDLKELGEEGRYDSLAAPGLGLVQK